MSLSEKFIKKYMRIAKLIGEDQNPCYSRHIGALIVNPETNKIVGAGYNGPGKALPHCDSADHLENIVWPQLTQEEKDIVLPKDEQTCNSFVEKFSECKTCPRKLINAPSAKRLELCSCEHAEKNAIYNSQCDLNGCWMFAWCPLACWDCAKAIRAAGISTFVCYGLDEYNFGVKWMFERANIKLIRNSIEYYLKD